MKTCSKCKERLPRSAFSLKSWQKHSGCCKPCNALLTETRPIEDKPLRCGKCCTTLRFQLNFVVGVLGLLLLCAMGLALISPLVNFSCRFSYLPFFCPAPPEVAQNFERVITQLQTVIPSLEHVPIATNPLEKYAVQQQQRKAIESLAVYSSLVNDAQILAKFRTVEKMTKEIGESLGVAEDAFKNAVTQIEVSTQTLLTSLPTLLTDLNTGQLCKATVTVWKLILMVSDLLAVLEKSRIPVDALKLDMSRLVSALQTLRTTVLASHVTLEAEKNVNTNRWFRDDDKHYRLQTSGSFMKNIDDLVGTLSSSVDPAEIQIQVAVDHLIGMKKGLENAYNSLHATLANLQTHKQTRLDDLPDCSAEEKVYLQSEELFDLKRTIQTVTTHVESVRLRNDPVVKQIYVLGFAAIKAN